MEVIPACNPLGRLLRLKRKSRRASTRIYSSSRRQARVGGTPCCCMGGHGEVVDFLLQRGAFVNTLDSLGRTPLGISIDKGESIVAPKLRAHGAKLDVREVPDGNEECAKVYLDQQSSYGEFPNAAREMPRKLYNSGC
ncbi:uncharacterized protein BJX67DRAFT_345774 [Aspergillus lucknowensis]|uniref:Ankyrin repeat-containing domain protein n=1 Tax=Aspergillus lucknowensis TaxID=176173 RepID=A0ABR4M1E5_9EURO